MGLKQIKRKKKGFLFTAGAIVLLTLLVVSYGIYDIAKKDDKVIKKRVETLNNFVFSLEEDLSRQVYASGYRIIFIFQKRIIDTGEYIDDFDYRFKEAFYNGTLYGENQSKYMKGVMFSDIENSLKENGERVNANVELRNSSISITQENPWEVKVILEGRLIVEDKGGLVSWNRTEKIEADIPIDTFEDPVYIVNTGGLITNRFNQTPYKPYTKGNDVSNLSNHVENSYYVANNNAPSFLQRFEGNLSENPENNGIESLVYLPELSDAGISVETKSCVDYIYFSSEDPLDYKIEGMEEWFRLDNESNRHEAYNVSNLVI